MWKHIIIVVQKHIKMFYYGRKFRTYFVAWVSFPLPQPPRSSYSPIYVRTFIITFFFDCNCNRKRTQTNLPRLDEPATLELTSCAANKFRGRIGPKFETNPELEKNCNKTKPKTNENSGTNSDFGILYLKKIKQTPVKFWTNPEFGNKCKKANKH